MNHRAQGNTSSNGRFRVRLGWGQERQKSCSPAGLELVVVWGPLALTAKPRSYQGLVTRGSPLCLYEEAVCGQSHRKPKSERKMTKGEREKNTEDRVGQSVPGK